jgi:flagellar basal-body rod protein FlgF
MDKLLYISMTGARESLDAQQLRANNLANVSTNGFKADYHQFRSMSVFGEHHPSRAYAMGERPGTDLSSGVLMETGRDLDVAIKGDGWLAVQLPDGTEAYTRAGDLQRDVSGMVVTGSGLPVMGDNGPIILPEYETLELGVDGTISIRGLGDDGQTITQINRLKLVNPDLSTLVKGEDGLMRTRDGAQVAPDANVQIVNGMLEGSNVNPVAELTGLITMSRLFELNVRLMKTAQENDEAAARMMQG